MHALSILAACCPIALVLAASVFARFASLSNRLLFLVASSLQFAGIFGILFPIVIGWVFADGDTSAEDAAHAYLSSVAATSVATCLIGAPLCRWLYVSLRPSPPA